MAPVEQVGVSGLVQQVICVLRALMKFTLPLLINPSAFKDLTNTRVWPDFDSYKYI